MSGAGSGYDLSTDVYSTEGRIFQVEYACKAVDTSSTAIGICCKDGVVLGVEKIRTIRMLEPNSNNRIHNVDRHAGMCICGHLPDGKRVISYAREDAERAREMDAMPILGNVLASRVSQTMHVFTTHYAYRPFGCSVLVASYADDGPQLFAVDPSGTMAGYHGIALGKAKTVAKTELEKLDFINLTCREALKHVAAILHQVHDNTKDKLYDLEFGWVCDESNRLFEHVPKELIPPAGSA